METLAAYVDGALEPEARAAVTAHLAVHEPCCELVSELAMAAEARAGDGEDSAGEPPTAGPTVGSRRPRITSGLRWLPLAAAIVLTAGASAVVYQMYPDLIDRFGSGTPDPELAPLVEALGPRRGVEGRLSGGFLYGPLVDPTRSEASPASNLSLLAAAGTLQKRAESDQNAENLHAWGVAQLLVGRHEESIETLTAAYDDQRNRASYVNDLAVAHMSRGIAADRADDFPRALELVEEAISLDPAFAEAWFNKAILLERLRLRTQAREAWSRYLELDPRGEWADHARRERDRLLAMPPQGRWPALEEGFKAKRDGEVLAEAAREFPEDVRDLIVHDWLPSWARARAEGRTGAARDAQRRIGAAVAGLVSANPDPLFASIAEELNAPLPCAAAEHVRGIMSLAGGSRALAAANYGDARTALGAAVRALDPCGSTLASWARLQRAHIAYVDGDAHLTSALLARVTADANRLSASVLGGRARLLEGIAAFTSGDWRGAAEAYERGLRETDKGGERQIAARIHMNASVLHRFLGNRERSWSHRMAAATLVPRHRPSQVHGYLITGAITASQHDFARAALTFQNEVVQHAQERLTPAHTAEALFTRARMHGRMQDHQAAAADLRASSRAFDAIADATLRRRIRRSWLVASAEVNAERDPALAATHAAEAITITGDREPMRSAEVRLFESRALAALGDLAGARAAAERGLADFEVALASFDPKDSAQLSALEPVWQLYSHAARLHLPPIGKDLPQAFALYERSRARTLLSRRGRTAISLAEVQARLAPDNAILMLDQAPEELLSWKITARDVDVQRTPCTESQTRQLIARHRRAIAGGQRRDPASAALFDCVLAPWSSSLDATAVVAVVPDGAWHRVAWPALWDRSTGRELIHRMFTVVAPSASIAASGAARPGASVEAAALVVSVAAGGSSRAPLPAARAEARAVAALYPGSRLLEGADATPAHVAREALHARVIHVSSHASDVPAYPLLSHLVLSGEPPNGDALYARDVARLDLARTDLVVLAACGTAGERAVRGEGSVGMAWSFLVAGAARVIATLDDVEDRAASEVFVDIHRRLAAGIPAVESVGRVQRELAAAGAPPRVWATVTVVGAL